MDWRQISELCQAELQRLRADLPEPSLFISSPEQTVATFFELEQSTNQKVEVAVRQFAAKRTWPALSVVERTMLSFRLEFAASLSYLLSEQPAPWIDSDSLQHDEQRLGWLMLFAWEHEGFSTLHENLGRLIPKTAHKI